jgi:hypothetical protein
MGLQAHERSPTKDLALATGFSYMRIEQDWGDFRRSSPPNLPDLHSPVSARPSPSLCTSLPSPVAQWFMEDRAEKTGLPSQNLSHLPGPYRYY